MPLHNLKKLLREMKGQRYMRTFMMEVRKGIDDVDIQRFPLQLDTWVALPEEVAKNVETYAQSFNEKRTVMLTRFGPDSWIKAHKHSKYIEQISVLDGELILLTPEGPTYFTKGSSLVIPANTDHHILSDEGCLLSIIFVPVGKQNTLSANGDP